MKTESCRPDDGLDGDLVLAAQGGDMGAFAELYARLAPSLYTWGSIRIPRELRRWADPEDLLQEVWCRAIQSITSFHDSEGSFRGWTFGIARHVLLKMFRRLRERPRGDDAIRSVFDLESVPEEITDLSSRIRRDEELRLFLHRLEILGQEERLLFLLRGLERRSMAEIADRLDISAVAAKKRWQRLRERLLDMAPPPHLVPA